MQDYAAKLQDAILSRSALFDDLVDEEAKIILDWAMIQAERVAATVQDEEDYDTKRSMLGKLLKGMSRLVAFRERKDAEWYAEKLVQLNAYSLAIGGPTLSEAQQVTLKSHSQMSNIELLRTVINMFTPPKEAEIEAYTPPVLEVDLHVPPPTEVDTYQAPELDIKPHIPPPTDIILDENEGEENS